MRKAVKELVQRDLESLGREFWKRIHATSWVSGQNQKENLVADLLVSAFVSKLAYMHITEEERKMRHRASLIPSMTFSQTLHYEIDLNRVFGMLDIAPQFIMRKNFVVAVLRVRNLTLVGVRGTIPGFKYRFDSYLHLRALPVRRKNFPLKVQGAYFGEAEQILAELVELKGVNLDPPDNNYLIFSGHSLGGAIVEILSLHPRSADRPRVGFYSFASPRVFGKPVDKSYEMRQQLGARVFNQNDLIPKLPPKFAGFKELPANKPVVQIMRPSSHSVAGRILRGATHACLAVDHSIETCIKDLETDFNTWQWSSPGLG